MGIRAEKGVDGRVLSGSFDAIRISGGWGFVVGEVFGDGSGDVGESVRWLRSTFCEGGSHCVCVKLGKRVSDWKKAVVED